MGITTKDRAKQDKAVADLVQYTQDFGAFYARPTPISQRMPWRT